MLCSSWSNACAGAPSLKTLGFSRPQPAQLRKNSPGCARIPHAAHYDAPRGRGDAIERGNPGPAARWIDASPGVLASDRVTNARGIAMSRVFQRRSSQSP